MEEVNVFILEVIRRVVKYPPENEMNIDDDAFTGADNWTCLSADTLVTAQKRKNPISDTKRVLEKISHCQRKFRKLDGAIH